MEKSSQLFPRDEGIHWFCLSGLGAQGTDCTIRALRLSACLGTLGSTQHEFTITHTANLIKASKRI